MKSSTGRIIFASVVLFLLILWVFLTFLEPSADNQLIATEATVISRPSRSKFDRDEINTDLFKRFLERYGAIPPRVSEVAMALPPSDKKTDAEKVSAQMTEDNDEVNKSPKVQRDVSIIKFANINLETVTNLNISKSPYAKLGLNLTTGRNDEHWANISKPKEISENVIGNSLTGDTNRYSQFYMCDDTISVQPESEVTNNVNQKSILHTKENKMISLKAFNATTEVIKPETFLRGILRNNSRQVLGVSQDSPQHVQSKIQVMLVNCSQHRVIRKRDVVNTAEFVEEERIERLCPSQPLLSVKDGSGRLGSRLWQYAALWTLPRSLPGLGRLPFIPRRILRTLRRVFVNISMPVLEDIPLHCKYRQQLMNSRPLKHDGFRPMAELLRRVPPGAPVLLRRSAVLPEPVLPLLPELRRQLRFRPKLVAVAQHSLRQFREKRAPEAVDVRFVGTFVARGKSIRANHFLRDPPGAEYLQEVLQSYRSERHRTLFVVASDDLRWCKRHLASGKDDMLLVHTSSPQTLALLSACNMSLVYQSDLGLWAAFLSGQPSHVIPSNPFLDSLLSKLPGWSLLPDPKEEIHLPTN